MQKACGRKGSLMEQAIIKIGHRKEIKVELKEGVSDRSIEKSCIGIIDFANKNVGATGFSLMKNIKSAVDQAREQAMKEIEELNRNS